GMQPAGVPAAIATRCEFRTEDQSRAVRLVEGLRYQPPKVVRGRRNGSHPYLGRDVAKAQVVEYAFGSNAIQNRDIARSRKPDSLSTVGRVASAVAANCFSGHWPKEPQVQSRQPRRGQLI